MVIVGWIIWAITCVFLLTFLLSALSRRDPGFRNHHLRFSVLLLVGLLITVLTSFSKLHLLWWIPVAFVVNMLLSNLLLFVRFKIGMNKVEKQLGNKSMKNN